MAETGSSEEGKHHHEAHANVVRFRPWKVLSRNGAIQWLGAKERDPRGSTGAWDQKHGPGGNARGAATQEQF
jgi:hypothetical protein